MLQILSLIAPVFGLIAVGYAAASTRYTSDGAAKVVIEIAYKVVLPALLFRSMLAIGELPVSPLLLLAAYASCVLAAWMLTTLVSLLLLRRPAKDAPALAMAGTFGNGLMLGFPIVLTTFGPEAATPMAILATCDSVILWLTGTLHMEIVRRTGGGGGFKVVAGVLGDVARNPLIVALAAGALCRSAEVQLPAIPSRLLDLMAGAATPMALIGLGMSLAAYRIAGETPALAAILIVKMILAPLIGLALAVPVFGLPTLWAGVLVAFLAMPVGANAFLFASRYERAIAPVSAAVAVSTVVSVLTITLTLSLLEAQGLMR
jgi:hypothetical protein